MISQNWQAALANAITDPKQLLTTLNLNSELSNAAIQQFPFRVTHEFVARMEKGNPKDPLLLQVLPLGQELQPATGFSLDPLAEKSATRAPGLLHKYRDRVLFTLTSACAINCRYCFRRHFPYADNNPAIQGWQQAISYIATHVEIKEVILSGGDPLIVKDAQLQELLKKLAVIPHLKRLRIHTRLPIVLPQRITTELLQALTSTPLQIVVVVHVNHANEIDNPVRNIINLLRDARIPVFNQSVLLKNINDSVTTLINLSETLFAAGIIPYYLHMLDKVQGAAHFDVSEETARQLVWEMMQQLPGYLVPKLVREEPGMPAKSPIAVL